MAFLVRRLRACAAVPRDVGYFVSQWKQANFDLVNLNPFADHHEKFARLITSAIFSNFQVLYTIRPLEVVRHIREIYGFSNFHCYLFSFRRSTNHTTPPINMPKGSNDAIWCHEVPSFCSLIAGKKCSGKLSHKYPHIVLAPLGTFSRNEKVQLLQNGKR